MKNDKVKAATVKPGTTEVTSTAVLKGGNSEAEISKRMAQAEANRRKYTKVTDIIAGDDIVLGNETLPNAKELWPHEFGAPWKLYSAQLYYPYAKIYFDLPNTQADVAICEKKMALNDHPQWKKDGRRYCYVKTGEDEMDVRARMGDAEAKSFVEERIARAAHLIREQEARADRKSEARI